ncbi:MAG: metalloregulator ArsR/SmtB family transcription factor [Bdellovibrionales bacterium]|nr:metalloregulator ArsR/SmtB family transcription factor [Bdellovibrionales bacterium]
MASKSQVDQELEAFEAVFKALGNKSRRHILTVLNARGGQMSAGDIAKRFSCSWPATTRHLRLLETAGLVRVDQQGREWFYRLEHERMKSVMNKWLKWFQ